MLAFASLLLQQQLLFHSARDARDGGGNNDGCIDRSDAGGEHFLSAALSKPATVAGSPCPASGKLVTAQVQTSLSVMRHMLPHGLSIIDDLQSTSSSTFVLATMTAICQRQSTVYQ